MGLTPALSQPGSEPADNLARPVSLLGNQWLTSPAAQVSRAAKEMPIGSPVAEYDKAQYALPRAVGGMEAVPQGAAGR